MLKVTIHQPEHFPYMGFFQKVSAADLWVVLDNVNFRKNYFQNRNKIKLKNGKDDWLTVPVEKKASSKHIKDVKVSQDPNWKRKLLSKIKLNLNLDLDYIYEPTQLIDINMRSIKWALKKLNIKKEIIFSSGLKATGSKSELLFNILREVGASHYISGSGGKNYLDTNLFNGINVTFFEPKVEDYYSSVTHLHECG